MSLATITVTGVILQPSGEPVAAARVRAELTHQEIDGGIIVPMAVESITDAAGAFSLELWPNARGVAGSRYRVTAARQRVTWLEVMITVPDASPTVAIEQIIDQAPYPPLPVVQVAQQAAQDAAIRAEISAQSVAEGVVVVNAAAGRAEAAELATHDWAQASAAHALATQSDRSAATAAASLSGAHAAQSLSAAQAANLALLGLGEFLSHGVGVFVVNAAGDLIAEFNASTVSGMQIDAAGSLVITY